MQEITTIPEAFVFWWYPDGWAPRAIIADISKFNDEAMEQMNIIINAGKSNIFYRSRKPNCETKLHKSLETREAATTGVDKGPGDDKTTMVFTGLDNEPIVFDDKTRMILNTWETLADQHNFYIHEEENNPDHWIHHSREYYINDVNSNLSPVNLHRKLSSLTCHPHDSTFKFKV